MCSALLGCSSNEEFTSEDLYIVVDLQDGAGCRIERLSQMPSGGWTNECKTTKLVLRRIEPGKFMMGSPKNEPFRWAHETQHEVTLTKPYYIGVFEITQRQYELITGVNPSSTKDPVRPVTEVLYQHIRGPLAECSWPESHAVSADSFLGKLRAKTGIEGFDLPTEAMWEYACRAGTDGATYAPLREIARCLGVRRIRTDRKGPTVVVGSYRPNAWGIYDMIGNVWEVTLDRYQDDLGADSVVDPVGPKTGDQRTVRGGSWAYGADVNRAAMRCPADLEHPNPRDGFRIALYLD